MKPIKSLIYSGIKSALLLTLVFFTHNSFSQPGANDPAFNSMDDGRFGTGVGANSSVWTSVLLPGGSVFMAGNFTNYNGTALNRVGIVNSDGSLSTGFNPGTGADSVIYTSFVQPDGKIFIAGNFANYNSTARLRVARLNADGSNDGTFNPGTGANSVVYTAAVLSGGKILIAGNFTSYNGTSINRIARLNANGTLDATFTVGTGASGIVRSIVVQSDGKILIGGDFTRYNGITRNRIARLNADGTLDATFNPGTAANNSIYAIAIQNDGKMILGGNFTSYNGTTINRVARITTTGALDATFNPGTGANGVVRSIAIQTDGKILLGGSFSTINSITYNRIIRLNVNGTVDGVFNAGAGVNSDILTLNLQTDGNIVIAGNFTTTDGNRRNRLARLNSSGLLDVQFAQTPGAGGTVYAAALQSDGKILFGGDFTLFGGLSRTRLARANADGNGDPSFVNGTGANNSVRTISIQTDGKIIIGGLFTAYNGTSINRIARLNADGTLDGTFNVGTGTENNVLVSRVQPDGKILIGGDFTTYNGTTVNRIVRLNSDGSIDATFSVGTGFNGGVRTIVLQPDGKVLVGGLFTTYNGTARNRIIRLNANGSVDATFNPGTGANGDVNAIAVQADGKILLGGNFTTYNGTARNRIVRVTSAGAIDATFNPGTGVNNRITGILLQSDNKVIVTGYFTTMNGVANNRIGRFNNDGTVDATFISGTGASTNIETSIYQPDGKVVIGGSFTSYNNIIRTRVARIISCVAVGTPSVPSTASPVICQGSGTTAFTSTAANASSYIWTVSGTGNTISGTGSTATVTWNPSFTGTATITVTAVGCNGNSSAVSTAVTVAAAATATISSNNGPVCAGSNAVFQLSGTTGATVTYKINGGVNQTIVLTGGVATITVSNIAASQTLQLVSVNNGSCNVALSNTSVVSLVPNNWIGGTGNWNVGSNWSCNHVPLSAETVTISSGMPLMNVDVTVAGSLSISGTGGLVIAPGKTLTISGTANFGARPVTVKSDATGTASIGRITGTLTGATKVTVERYIPATKRAWRMLCMPLKDATDKTMFYNWQNNGVAGTTGVEIWGPNGSNPAYASPNGLANGTGYSVTKYENGAWVNVDNTKTEQLFTGTANNAFMVFVTGPFKNGSGRIAGNSGFEATTLVSTGTLITGNSSFSAPGVSNRFYLVANPYASAIDPGTLTSSNLANQLWMWDPNLAGTSGLGGYVSFDRTFKVYNIVTGGYSNAPYTHIQSGQAFFVRSVPAPGGNVTVNFTESNKSTRTTNAVFRTQAANTTNKVEGGSADFVRVTLQKNQSNTLVSTDGAVAFFYDGGNAAVDEQDGIKLNNSADNISFRRTGANLTFEHLPVLNLSDTLYLNMTNTAIGSYRLVLENNFVSAAGAVPVLQDLFLNTETPLNLTGNSQVDFSVTNAAASGGQRFRIIFRQGSSLPVTLLGVKAYAKGSGVQVEWTTVNEELMNGYEVERSTDGSHFTKQFYVASRNSVQVQTYEWLDVNPLNSTNYYRIKTLDLDGRYKYSNVVRVQRDHTSTGVSVYPTIVTGKTITVELNRMQAGTYELVLSNAAGQQMYRTKIVHAGGSSTQSVNLANAALLPGVYHLQVKGDNNTSEAIRLVVQ